MAITWAYSLDSDKSLIQDFSAAIAGDTVATQTSGTAGSYSPAQGDIVSLNDQGRACLALQATVSGSQYLNAAKVLGVCEGGNFLGLAAGGTYAATTVTNNHDSSKLAKVHTSTTDVYRVPLKSGATAPVVGVAYSILIDATHGAELDTSNPAGTTQVFRVVEYDADNSLAYGVFTALELAS